MPGIVTPPQRRRLRRCETLARCPIFSALYSDPEPSISSPNSLLPSNFRLPNSTMAEESLPHVAVGHTSSSPEPGPEEVRERLRYLEFVNAVAIQTLLCASRIYGFSKESAGPLKPGVQSLEGTVKTVVGPVYDRFRDVPFDFIKFVDQKVGESVEELERRVPSVVKDASAMARSAASEVRRTGLIASTAGLAHSVYAEYEPAVKALYAKYESAAELAAASAWRSLNRLPLAPQVAQVVVPAAANLSEKYNQAVTYSADKGYAISAYLPLVPMERIGRVFSDEATAH